METRRNFITHYFFLATLLTPNRITKIASVLIQVNTTVKANKQTFAKLEWFVELMLLIQTNRFLFCLVPPVAPKLHTFKTRKTESQRWQTKRVIIHLVC